MNTLLSRAITNIGQRSNNEDSFLEIIGKNIFLVCDGVGGAAKGEVASKLCCDCFQDYFEQNNIAYPDQKEIQKALQYTENCFTEYIQKNEASEGMATTLTLLAIRNDEAHVAHAGDSRVYHVRDGEILFATEDHSLVAEMVASGFITQEEALTHPKKNVIKRAIQGNDSPTDAEFTTIQNVELGDYFLLCSDGVLESVSEDFISKIFKASNTVEQITNQIEEICLQNSRDNFTAIAIQVSQPNLPVLIESLSSAEISKELKSKNEGDFVSVKTLSRKRKKFLFILIMIALLGSVAFFYFTFKKTPPAPKPDFPNKTKVEKVKVKDKKIRISVINPSNKIFDSLNAGVKVLDDGTKLITPLTGKKKHSAQAEKTGSRNTDTANQKIRNNLQSEVNKAIQDGISKSRDTSKSSVTFIEQKN